MILRMFAIYDSASQSFARPWFVAAAGQATRVFTDEVRRVAADNDLNKHPQDFVLFSLGTFDDNTGAFECSPPVQVLRAVDVIESRQ